MERLSNASTSLITAEMSTTGSSDRIFSAITLNTLQIGLNSNADASGSSDQLGDEWPMFHGALNHTGVVSFGSGVLTPSDADPAESAVAAEQAASSRAASVVSAHTADQIISVVTVQTADRSSALAVALAVVPDVLRRPVASSTQPL